MGTEGGTVNSHGLQVEPDFPESLRRIGMNMYFSVVVLAFEGSDNLHQTTDVLNRAYDIVYQHDTDKPGFTAQGFLQIFFLDKAIGCGKRCHLPAKLFQQPGIFRYRGVFDAAEDDLTLSFLPNKTV